MVVKKIMFRKILVIGIIVLFIGISIAPSISSLKECNELIGYKEKTDNFILEDKDDNQISYRFDKIKNREYWALCYSQSESDGSLLLLKESLCKSGWNETHIRLLDGEDITEQDFIDNITWLDDNEDSEDIILIFISSHGYTGGFNLMSYYELNEQLNRLDSEKMAIFIATCHSGSAISFCEDDGRVIVSSCGDDELSHDAHWDMILALSGIGDYVGNNNGRVAAEEVYFYLINALEDIQTPCISDNVPGLLNLVFLSYEDTQVDQKQIYQSSLSSISDEYHHAQSFIPSFNKLTKIKILVDTYGRIGNLTLVIRDELDGENLATVSVHIEALRRYVLVEFDFPDIYVNTDETYYMVISGPHVQFKIIGYHEDLYEDGEAYFSGDGGDSWQDHFFPDLFFITFGYRDNTIIYHWENTILYHFRPI